MTIEQMRVSYTPDGYVALWNCPQSRGDYYTAQGIARRKRLGIWKTDGSWQASWHYR